MSDFLGKADHVSAGRFDYALKHWLNEGFAIKEDGSVDEYGHIALMEITREDVAFFAGQEGDPRMTTDFTPGWYVVQTNGLGFVYGHHYETEKVARDDFETATWIMAQAAAGVEDPWL